METKGIPQQAATGEIGGFAGLGVSWERNLVNVGLLLAEAALLVALAPRKPTAEAGP